MRLDPAAVRFVTPILQLDLFASTLRFVGRENNVQLMEPALAVEGNVLKVGFLGVEVLFRRALAEWTTVTVPYSRIERARLVRYPAGRRVAALVLAACLVLPFLTCLFVDAAMAGGQAAAGVVVGVVAVVVWFRVKPRYEVRFRGKDGRRRAFLFRILSRPLAAEFDAKMQEYRAAAGGYKAGEPAGGGA